MRRVASSHPLKVGVRLHLETESGEETTGVVIQVDPSKICLQIPPGMEQIQAGEAILVTYWQKDVVYCWQAKVVDASNGERTSIAVSVGEDGLTVQRRKGLRVRLTVPFSFLVTDSTRNLLANKREYSCHTRNISMNGLKFETNLELSVTDKLALRIELPGAQKVNAYGWVVRSELLERNGKVLRSVAVEFLHLEEKDQRRLMQFLGEISGDGR